MISKVNFSNSKSIFVLVAAMAFIPMASAQFYGASTTGRGGQVSIHGGIASTSASPLFSKSTIYSDTWGQSWALWEEVKADKVTPSVGASFLLALASHRDVSEQYRSGLFFGVGFTMSQWKADFSNLVSGCDYSLWAKSNLIDIQLGYDGSFKPSEAVSIDFNIAPYILFPVGSQVRSELSFNGTLVGNGDNAEWHEGEKVEDMSAPSIDLGAIARIGANYHFSETMWVGAAFQYRLPFVNFADVVSDEYTKDGFRQADNYVQYSDIKHKGWSLMLTFGIDFD